MLYLDVHAYSTTPLTVVMMDATQQPLLSAASPTTAPAVCITAIRGAAYHFHADQSRFLFQLRKGIVCPMHFSESIDVSCTEVEETLERILMLIKSHITPY